MEAERRGRTPENRRNLSRTERREALDSDGEADLNGVEEGSKLPQQGPPHVVAAARVGQNQDGRPASAAGGAQLHRQRFSSSLRRRGAAARPAPDSP